MKLIDRDELLRNIEADIDISVTGVRNMEAVKCCLQNILDDVKESPVVDAVPVIRCKECKCWKPSMTDVTEHVCHWGGFRKNADDYCSWAERREECSR